MKRIVFDRKNRSDNLLHIEAPGCIVNIRVNLRNTEGREVTSVQIIADYDLDEKWKLHGSINNRVIAPKKEVMA